MEVEHALGIHPGEPDDGGSGGPGPHSPAFRPKDQASSPEAQRQREREKQEVRRRAILEVKRKATLYYKHVEGWDFTRPQSDCGSIDEADFGGLNPANDMVYANVKRNDAGA